MVSLMKGHTLHILLECLLPIRTIMQILNLACSGLALLDRQASMCTHTDTVTHRPFLCFHGQYEGEEK